MNRINYIDGLKGISTLIVFFSHFVGAFTCLSFLKNIPGINLLLDGTTAVHIFIILSGFSICYSLTNNSNLETAISRIILKRYFRLALPIILPTIFAYIFYICGFCYNQQIGSLLENQWLCELMPSNISIANFASSLIFGPIRSSLITPLWMMHFIFFGTFLIIPICVCANTINKKYRYYFLLIISIIILKYNVYYFSSSVGVLIYFYIKDEYSYSHISKVLGIFSLVILCLSLFMDTSYIHIIRAFAIILLVINLPFFQYLLSLPTLLNLNKIGYQIYLVHAPIICSWSCFFYSKQEVNSTMILLNFISTAIFVFFTANIFSRVDTFTGKYLNRTLMKVL
jgi:peptidoglycan/LPS O-acetylase OafA/YrhL